MGYQERVVQTQLSELDKREQDLNYGYLLFAACTLFLINFIFGTK